MSTTPASTSAYEMSHTDSKERRATFAVIVDNEPGVLHRVVGLFAGRGYNIESLTVAETDHKAHTSRITIVTSGTPEVLEQIRAQLDKTVCVRDIQDVTADPLGVEIELALVKAKATPEAQAIAKAAGARAVEADVFEITGSSAQIETFLTQLRKLGPVEHARTGVLSITRD